MKKFICTLLAIFLAGTSLLTPVYASDAKTAALQELSDIFKLYDDYDYSDNNWALLESAYNQGIEDINSSVGTEAVYEALNTAAENMISVHSKYSSITICISVDKFVLNKGFMITPELIKIRKYSPASQVLVDFFEQKYENTIKRPIFYNGTVENNFELISLHEEPIVSTEMDEVQLPNYLTPYITYPILEKTISSPLSAGDYTDESCYLYSINNKFPNVKASAIPLVEDDVLRWHFSIYGKGADLGANTYYSSPAICSGADKSEAFWALADIHKKYDIELLLTDEQNLNYYTSAIKALVIPNVSQNAVDKALDKLESIKPVTSTPEETPDTPPAEAPDEPQETITFSDVSDTHFAKEAITYLTTNKITNGMPDGSFGADNTLTRAELATMLARAAGYTNEDEIPFEDVGKNDWYYSGVAFCYENGITNGQTPTTFNPHAKITRQELATMLYRYAVYANIQLQETDKPAFNDADTFAEFAADAIKLLHRSDIVSGYDGNVFMPLNNATRGEMAKMLYALIK